MMRLHRALLRSGAAVGGASAAGAASDFGFMATLDLAAAPAGAVAGLGTSGVGASAATRADGGGVASSLGCTADAGRESTGGASADVDAAFAGFDAAGDAPGIEGSPAAVRPPDTRAPPDCVAPAAGTSGPFDSRSLAATTMMAMPIAATEMTGIINLRAISPARLDLT